MTPVERPLVVHRATSSAIGVLSRLRPYFPDWPAVLPSEDDPTIRPLLVGIDRALIARAVIPEGVTSQDVAAEIHRALGYLVKGNNYRRALVVPGAMRYDIDGVPVEPVSERDREYTRSKLPGYIPPAKSVPNLHEVIPVKISALKVSLPLTPDQLPSVTETVKTVDLQIDLGDGRPITVGFSGKNYRKALRQVNELRATGAEVIVLMQGRLVGGGRIEGAGLSVQTRTPKPATATG